MPCTRCGGCCGSESAYVCRTVDPTAETEAYEAFLEFTRPKMFVRAPGGLLVKAPCEHLVDGNVCGVYDNRPKVCREFLCHKANDNQLSRRSDQMKLNVTERIVLLGVLPEEGNFLTLRIVRQLREALSFSEEETKALELKQDGTAVTWNTKSPAVEADIAIGEKATDLIVERLKKLDEQQKLTAQHFSLYEKFVLPKPVEPE